MFKALIIDDERPARQAILALGKWKKYGIEPPAEASNCRAALAMMEENQPDIVFLDMYLPVMSGIEFLKKAAPASPKTIFITVSGFDEFEYARQSLRYGVLEYLLKPIMEEELERALARAVDILDAGAVQTVPGEWEYRRQESEAQHFEGLHKKIISELTKENVVKEIQTYIEMNYADEISLTMLSQWYYFSKEYLSRCFKEAAGCGIYEFVTDTRMKKAKELLMNTNAKISVVAKMVGYKDQNYFSRVFKKYYGVYPSEFKTQNEKIGGR
ncbi:MAG: helix-turn-helix domain-containing protein [Oscillospiraceae bacterium]|nr:helix-turn-helix domain-containing protein [Oscillospiraceae bacterium]